MMRCGMVIALVWPIVAPLRAAFAEAGERRGAAAATAQADPHRQLHQILQQPLYQRWKLRQERTALQNRQSWLLQHGHQMIRALAKSIRDFLDQWLEGLRGPQMPSLSGNVSTMLAVLKFVAWTALAVAAVFIALLVYKTLRNSNRAGLGARVLSRRQVRQALQHGEALAMGSPQWLEQAQRLAEEHNFRAMYRALYLALLSGLHSADKINFRRNRTNWTYVARYRGPDDERDIFRELTKLFDDVWYGLKSAAGTNLETVQRKVKRLIEPRTADG